ncbi:MULTISPECIES: hypothetical protein [unclassified Streptococcus]|uniref:hypothetical protein n=1 Tax=unclassified Streptococcus TaxID=2608887 RepID=UPI000B212451|nr:MULTISPECIES: hypothetical protein [unclassified Streptococcus]
MNNKSLLKQITIEKKILESINGGYAVFLPDEKPVDIDGDGKFRGILVPKVDLRARP